MDRIHVASFLPVPEHGIEAIKAVDPRIDLHMISQNFARYIRDPEHPGGRCGGGARGIS